MKYTHRSLVETTLNVWAKEEHRVFTTEEVRLWVTQAEDIPAQDVAEAVDEWIGAYVDDHGYVSTRIQVPAAVPGGVTELVVHHHESVEVCGYRRGEVLTRPATVGPDAE